MEPDQKKEMTNIETGLTQEEVNQRQKTDGKNVFAEQKETPYIMKFLYSLTDFTTIILLIAAGISFYTEFITQSGHYFEGLLIIAIVLINSALTIFQEGRAEKSLAALKKMNQEEVYVLRDGEHQVISAEELVVGDLVLLENGSLIPADAKLVSTTSFRVDESALTGESEPLDKSEEYQAGKDDVLSDRLDLVFKGTTVSSGRAQAIVTAIGMQTEMGKIASLLNEEKAEKTPLQNRLNKLGKNISILAVLASAIVFALGFYQGEAPLDIFMIAVSLAVAAVPETLTVIVTLTLADGVQKMAKKRAIVRQLPAVETLGSASVICSDKTGTLTENKMRVRRLYIEGGEVTEAHGEFSNHSLEVLKMASLCTNVVVEKDGDELEVLGNPTEAAIVRALEDSYYTIDEITDKYPRIEEIPFDSTRKMMTTFHQMGERFISITKGAFDLLSEKIIYGDLPHASYVNERFGKEALRVIAVGFKVYDEKPENLTAEELENDLHLMGLIGIIDPPRAESKVAIAQAKEAGIKTVMITGDHAVTASAIAVELGIMDKGDSAMTGTELKQLTDDQLDEKIEKQAVFARVTPEDKIRIVKSWQRTGAVVAMTGDGVNDAPALKASDVGCAMGITGTDVAKGAADIILTDDNYATIVDAVAMGRTVYQNIKKTVAFLLSCNISEVFAVLIAMLLGWGSPFTAVHLLFINVVADGLPGFALGREPGDEDNMRQKPLKKNMSIFGGGTWQQIAIGAISFTIISLWAFYIGNNSNTLSHWLMGSAAVGQTMAFLVLSYSSILQVFNVRSEKSIFKVNLLSNKKLVQMALLSIAITTVIAFVPVFQNMFELTSLSLNHWLVVLGLSIIPTIIYEGIKFWRSPEVSQETTQDVAPVKS
ncbi:cation-translocating P-type ATPase [Enterococcus timonensis]|uniref:cation-translocating P-type ATPase n=1 Tax=Enterococcus timonensis TaxID=1852364 RepID=UPI0008D9BC63|nr:cation-translocating P-type ATPase [Enterococcus timonensis]